MYKDIVKVSADHLRSSLDENHNIKLKSSHAHEIVASLFGYKSKASMLTDEKYPISNLEKSELMMFEKELSLIDDRMKELKDLPDKMPSNDILAETVYSLFQNKTAGQRKAHTTFEDMAIELAKLHYAKHRGKLPLGSDWSREVKVEIGDNLEIVLFIDNKNRKGYHDIFISLPRVSGTVGYGKPKIESVFFENEVRDKNEPSMHNQPYNGRFKND